jgi:hypothetical protein
MTRKEKIVSIVSVLVIIMSLIFIIKSIGIINKYPQYSALIKSSVSNVFYSDQINEFFSVNSCNVEINQS